MKGQAARRFSKGLIVAVRVIVVAGAAGVDIGAIDAAIPV